MITVGIRELKQQTSELIRRVREEGHEIQVTYHGKVVARLVPVNTPEPAKGERAWADLDSLAAQVGERWPDGISAAETVSEGRRT